MLDCFGIDLRGLPIFAGLEAADIAPFIEEMDGRLQWFESRKLIRYHVDGNPYIGVVAKGTVQVIVTDRADHELMGYELQEGAVFGNVWAVMGADACNAVSVDVRPQTAVLWLSYQKMMCGCAAVGDARQARVHGIVTQNLFASLSRIMFVMLQKIEVLSQHTLRERLCLYMMQQAKAQGTARVRIPRRVELSKALGCNRSALTREVGRMEDEGLLVCGDGWMELTGGTGCRVSPCANAPMKKQKAL